jgi:hypothetical protein
MTHGLRERRLMQWWISIVLRWTLLLLFTFAQKTRKARLGRQGPLRPSHSMNRRRRRVAGKALKLNSGPAASGAEPAGRAQQLNQPAQQLSHALGHTRWAGAFRGQGEHQNSSDLGFSYRTV